MSLSAGDDGSVRVGGTRLLLDVVIYRKLLDWPGGRTSKYSCGTQARGVLVSRDKKTLIALAFERVRESQPMPGLLIIAANLSIGGAIEGLVGVACSSAEQWQGQVRYLPL